MEMASCPTLKKMFPTKKMMRRSLKLINMKSRSTVKRIISLPLTTKLTLRSVGLPFKYGLIEFEDDLPNSFYYCDPKGREHINARQEVKRFLKQVRESKGYAVDCFPAGVYSPFFPGFHVPKEKPLHDHMMELAHFAIEKINALTGKTYEAVEIENANYTSYSLYLLTFTVKNAGTENDASLEAIRAMVYAPYKDDYTLKEWMFKPSIMGDSYTGRVDVDQGNKKAKIGIAHAIFLDSTL